MTSALGTEAMEMDEAPDRADEATGWFVYGVVSSATPIPEDVAGLGGAPVVTIAAGRVAAVASEAALERPPGRGAEILGYHAVLDALVESAVPVAPVRFGSFVPDEAGIVEEFLGPDEDYFVDLLERLAGKAQFRLQARYDEQRLLREIVASDDEIARLRDRTRALPEESVTAEHVRLGELVAGAVERRRDADADSLLADVLPWAEAYLARAVSGLEPVCDVALLVADEQVQQLEVRLERLAEELHGRMTLRLTGPTAPYDFVGDA